MQNQTIARVEVDGLHDQFDVELNFHPGLNVLYGKNGRGKTTLLHILANVLELDFQRFQYLQFRRVLVRTHENHALEINRLGDDEKSTILVSLDNHLLGDINSIEEASIKGGLRHIFGGRPAYLPAFRAILERVRSEAFTELVRDPNYERIREEERIAQKDYDPQYRTYPPGSRFDPHGLTARKTIQCREWFGQFVPRVRYPSILEVMDRLTNEHRDAMLETGSQERRMLSEMFVEVFKALMSDEEAPTESEAESLMSRVQKALEIEAQSEEFEYYTDRIGSQLAQELGQVKMRGVQKGGDPDRKVLRLYATMLDRRNRERQQAFYKVRQFEKAVNKFLDGKRLCVSGDSRGSSGRVYVETDEQRRYPLSSLSSGERQVLTMLFSATRMATSHGAFLIDEPELSLHVDWQRIILGEIMAQAPDRQIIACTHSPEVGADHTESLQMFSPLSVERMLPEKPADTSFSIFDESV